MTPKVKQVNANPDFTLNLTFDNGESRQFDAKPYFGYGIFEELKDLSYFKLVKPFMGSVQWPHGQDFAPESLFEESVLV